MVKDDDSLVKAAHKAVLMGDHYDGRARLVKAHEQVDYLIAHLRVDVARRLVRNDDIGAVGKRPREGNSLLLAARKLLRIVPRLAVKTHEAQHKGHAPADLFLLGADNAHGERHIVKHRHIRYQTEILKDYAELAAEFRDIPFLYCIEHRAVHGDSARGRDLLTHHELQEGALACARGANNEYELALLNLYVDILERSGAVVVFFGNIVKFNHSIISLTVVRAI